jgi:hypothetical protein
MYYDGIDYTNTTTNIIFTTAPANGKVITIEYFSALSMVLTS